MEQHKQSNNLGHVKHAAVFHSACQADVEPWEDVSHEPVTMFVKTSAAGGRQLRKEEGTADAFKCGDEAMKRSSDGSGKTIRHLVRGCLSSAKLYYQRTASLQSVLSLNFFD